MLFNNLPFAVLLAVKFFFYYLPFMRVWQVHVLIAASFIFYPYDLPLLLLLLLVSILINVVTSYFIAMNWPSRHRFSASAGVKPPLSTEMSVAIFA